MEVPSFNLKAMEENTHQFIMEAVKLRYCVGTSNLLKALSQPYGAG